MQEIKNLKPDDQATVVQFAYKLDAERQLSGNEITALAKKMVATTDAVEKARIRTQITRGFYGTQDNA
jgi:hypothetical protein